MRTLTDILDAGEGHKIACGRHGNRYCEDDGVWDLTCEHCAENFRKLKLAPASERPAGDGNIWSDVRRLQELRLRVSVSDECVAVDDVKFLLSLLDQRDRAFKELIRIKASERPAESARTSLQEEQKDRCKMSSAKEVESRTRDGNPYR